MSRLADAVGMDQTNFAKRFRSATGLAPFAFLTAKRMERAQQFLLAGDQSVTSIALAVGYSNPGKFAQAFRRIVGYSPSEWRKTQLG